MEKIINQSHSVETFLNALSRTLERAAFYGLRSLLVLYMIGEILHMENEKALKIYGWFTASIVFSKIIGAILGDLIIGNKKAVIIGGIIQALGAFSFCISSINGLYIGLFLVVLGSGFYSPNIISNFGKLYLNKTKLLDAGFTIFYLAVNIGAFIGVLIIGYLRGKYGWNIGFFIAGNLMLLSIIPIIFLKEKKIEKKIVNNSIVNKRLVNIVFAFVLVSLFWSLYEMGNVRFYILQLKLSDISTINIPKSMLANLNSVFILPISILAIIVWTVFYNNQHFKITLGFIFGAISFGIIILIPETPIEKHINIYLLSLLFLSISEIHLAPIINSILTKNSNPKYLAILISLAFIPERLFSLFFLNIFSQKFYDNPILSLKFGLIGMIILSIGLIIFLKWKKKNYLFMTS